jgi:excisionase family DNA binding protein
MSLYDEKPKVISVKEAGWRYLGLKKKAAYEAVRRGEIPVLRVGNLLKVPVRAMELKLKKVEEA